MRNVLLTIVLIACMGCITARARTPIPMAVGLSYNRAFKNSQNGWAAKLQVPLNRRIRIEPEMLYFAEHDGVTTLNLSLNVHWCRRLFDGFSIYPFAGLNYSHWGYDGPNASRWGANLGCGAEYRFSGTISGFTEARLQCVAHETQPMVGAGLKYHF